MFVGFKSSHDEIAEALVVGIDASAEPAAEVLLQAGDRVEAPARFEARGRRGAQVDEVVRVKHLLVSRALRVKTHRRVQPQRAAEIQRAAQRGERVVCPVRLLRSSLSPGCSASRCETCHRSCTQAPNRYESRDESRTSGRLLPSRTLEPFGWLQTAIAGDRPRPARVEPVRSNPEIEPMPRRGLEHELLPQGQIPDRDVRES